MRKALKKKRGEAAKPAWARGGSVVREKVLNRKMDWKEKKNAIPRKKGGGGKGHNIQKGSNRE